jgi:PIN domain nuclease of toxin-antitoxin system
MRFLLDTCAFLWFIGGDPKALHRRDRGDRRPGKPDPAQRGQRVVSAWEIAIKHALGKLDLDAPPAVLVPEQLKANHIDVLPVTLDHVLSTASLPFHHRDSFDRLLVAQCLAEDLPFISAEVAFDDYGVRRVW